jgi:hypothetical protein
VQEKVAGVEGLDVPERFPEDPGTACAVEGNAPQRRQSLREEAHRIVPRLRDGALNRVRLHLADGGGKGVILRRRDEQTSPVLPAGKECR